MHTRFSSEAFPSREEVWAWQQKLNSLGPRLTGSSAHQQWIDYIDSELTRMGLKVERDQHTFTRWEAKFWSLSVLQENGKEEPLAVTSYYPYSGSTTPAGITGELVYCGKGKGDFRYAAGKIAIVEVAVTGLPTKLFFKPRTSYPQHEKLPRIQKNLVISSILRGPDLKKAEQAGVLGVICVWKGVPEELALGQYLPFTTPSEQCPALWVGEDNGEKLKRLALQKAQVRFVLHAEIVNNAESDSIYAVLPGMNTKENILVNTHTDGPNACEENGAVGLLAMANYFSSIPVERRKRNIVFMFITGHFQIPQFGIHGQATTRWLKDHPELWNGAGDHQKSVAGLTLEHLGCSEWKGEGLTAGGDQVRPEIELVYTGNTVMDEIYIKSVQDRSKVRSVTLRPKANIYFGEGQPIYQAGIPTISLIPAPDYLCAVGLEGHADKLDPELLYEQIGSFVTIAEVIDRTELDKLGEPEAQAKGIVGFFVKE